MVKAKKRKRRDRRVKLDQRPERRHRGIFPTPVHDTRYLAMELPFYSNPRGMLTHRVRSVAEHLRDGKVSHRSVTYWCNNGCCVRAGGEFIAEPDRLLCQFCEFNAARHRQPTAEQLTGHHCHVGKLRVEQVCCQDERDRN